MIKLTKQLLHSVRTVSNMLTKLKLIFRAEMKTFRNILANKFNIIKQNSNQQSQIIIKSQSGIS